MPPRPSSGIRVVRTRRGARLVQRDVTLSEVLDHPGPTHTLFDLLAATIAMLAPGPTAAVLGFAAGGLVAPLRGMGFGHPLDAVDLSAEGVALFESLSGPWTGEVRVRIAEAGTWLRRQRRRFDVLLEDLSEERPAGVTKPEVSLTSLPETIASRLGPNGLCVTNVLDVPGWSAKGLAERLARPHRGAIQIVCEDYENRILLAGDRLPTAATAGRLLRRGLRALGSRQADRFTLRTVKRSPDRRGQHRRR